MSTEYPPSARPRPHDSLFASERELGDVLEEVARLGVRLLLQTAIEAEVTEFLAVSATPTAIGPARQPQRSLPDHHQDHHRADHHRAPEAAGTDEAFASQLLGIGGCRTNAFEILVIAGFVRACRCETSRPPWPRPSRPEAALSKSTVSRVCGAIKDEFDAWESEISPDVAL